MPPSTKQPSSEKLFIILILFAGLALAYLFGSSIDFSIVVQPAAVRDTTELRSLNLDLTVLDSILFKQLRVFGIIPVNPGQTGRENPFTPF